MDMNKIREEIIRIVKDYSMLDHYRSSEEVADAIIEIINEEN